MNRMSKCLISLSLVACSGYASAQTPIYGITAELGSLTGTTGSSYTNWGSVNDSGQVTGYSIASGSQTPVAFLYTYTGTYSGGTLQNLGAISASQGYSVNATGQVVGTDGSCGFYYTAGFVQPLNNLLGECGSSASIFSVATAINDSGKIVGYSSAKGGATHAVFYSSGTSGGKIKDLGTLGGTTSYAYGLNNGGEATGYSTLSNGASHAFITVSGGLQDLGTLGGDSSVGYAINASGLVTGSSQTAGDAATHAFLYSNGAMHDLGSLGGTSSVGLAINNSGEVVGTSTTSSGAQRAFLVSGGKMYNLNNLIPISDPNQQYVTLTSATGISTSGLIVANGSDSRNPTVNEVFLLSVTDTLPTVTYKVTGTESANLWYTSPTTLSWVVKGVPAPTESGCYAGSVPDTTDTTYPCTATNSVGSFTNQVTIRKDSVPPAITITTPANGAVYKLNQALKAAYTCTDATSGVATCMGPVASGATISTTVSGPQTFTVTSTDVAGNSATATVSYTVGKK